MRFSCLLWVSMAVVGPLPGQAGLFGLFNRNQKEEEVVVGDNKTTTNSLTIHEIIHGERRHVLYNSRQLSGECLDICIPDRGGTDSPTPAKPDPTEDPTGGPTGAPTGTPTKTPTKAPSGAPSAAPSVGVDKPPPGGDDVCEGLVNLGFGYSKAIPEYEGCYPHVRNRYPEAYDKKDDGVAVFVGGNYLSKRAAEVEGKTVVMGDLMVKPQGISNIVSVGIGTHVIPASGSECVIIGGKIHAERDIQVFNQYDWMTCDIVYKGGRKSVERWKSAGAVRHEPDYDLTEYQKMKYYWRKKSQYWKTLDSTGEVLYEDWGNTEGRTTYQCGDDPVQVFNIYERDNKKMTQAVWGIYFTEKCEGKTILINVHGLNARMDAADMFDYNGKKDRGEFDTCLAESILWNFPDVEWLNLGAGGTSEWQGSILAAGNMKMTTSGQSGRTIVLGNVFHEHGGSEFHSYQFNPPYDLPEPPDICEPLPENWLAVANGEERVPSYKTEPEGCEPIDQVDLPEFGADGKKLYSASHANCLKCANGFKGKPCNRNPSICWGKACVLTNEV